MIGEDIAEINGRLADAAHQAVEFAKIAAIENTDAKLVGRAVTSQPVVTEGQTTSPVIIGDDYLARHNR